MGEPRIETADMALVDFVTAHSRQVADDRGEDLGISRGETGVDAGKRRVCSLAAWRRVPRGNSSLTEMNLELDFGRGYLLL